MIKTQKRISLTRFKNRLAKNYDKKEETQLLDYAFTEKIIDKNLLYPPIKSIFDLKTQLDSINTTFDEFLNSEVKLSIDSDKDIFIDDKQTLVKEVEFSWQNAKKIKCILIFN